MILELCVTELEDVATDISSRRNIPLPVVQETPHPYPDNATLSNVVVIPGKFLYNSDIYLYIFLILKFCISDCFLKYLKISTILFIYFKKTVNLPMI